jgi:DNA polymerase-3 subunit delta
LGLLHPNKLIDIDDVKLAVSDQSRFTVFQLVDDLLQGQYNKAVHILQRLEGEELEPVIISWALHKEVETLAQLQIGQAQGERIDTLFKTLRIWPQRQNLYRQALSRLDINALEELLAALGHFDLQYKTQGIVFPYTWLAHCCALFTADKDLQKFSHLWLEQVR